MAKEKKSALTEKKGVSQSEITNTSSIKNIKKRRQTEVNTDTLISSILKGHIPALRL